MNAIAIARHRRSASTTLAYRLRQTAFTVALGGLLGGSGATSACQVPAASAQPADEQVSSAPALRHKAPLFDDLGDLHHPITTASAKAQQYFNQGLTLTYAFNHAEAERSFREAARLDPNCPMAWWGVALVLGPNINKPMAPEDNPKAWEALQKARQCAANATPKEQAYVEALSHRYAEKTPQDRTALDKVYADAMRKLAKAYPDDLDAQTLFAESLMDTIPWQYWTPDKQAKPETKEILAALEGVLERHPKHAGACHYYIHAVEAVAPEKALAAADRLRTLVPGAGHLVHMPAHIYLRLGLYREATVMNELASRADESYISQCRAQGFYPVAYYPHNVHFLWYTNAMEGCSADSIAAAKKIAAHASHDHLAEEQRFEPLVPMTLIRFGQWDEVLKQPTPPADQRYESAMSHYARGLALTGKGEVDRADAELKALQAIAGDEKTKSLNTDTFPGAVLVQIAVHDLAGQLALKRDKNDEAVSELQKAVELEDSLPYMEPPFCYMPMRHGLGKALLAADRAKEAEKVYRQDLEKHPHNGWSLFGLSKSLAAQGKTEQADEVMRRFELAWIRADVKLTSSRF